LPPRRWSGRPAAPKPAILTAFVDALIDALDQLA
jgi:hypothetical protein